MQDPHHEISAQACVGAIVEKRFHVLRAKVRLGRKLLATVHDALVHLTATVIPSWIPPEVAEHLPGKSYLAHAPSLRGCAASGSAMTRS
jgi:hypothetical protein